MMEYIKFGIGFGIGYGLVKIISEKLARDVKIETIHTSEAN